MSAKDTIRDIVAEQLQLMKKTEDIDDKLFIKDLGADELDCIEIIMAIEEEFGHEIQDFDAEHLHSVNDIASYVKDHWGISGNDENDVASEEIPGV